MRGEFVLVVFLAFVLQMFSGNRPAMMCSLVYMLLVIWSINQQSAHILLINNTPQHTQSTSAPIIRTPLPPRRTRHRPLPRLYLQPPPPSPSPPMPLLDPPPPKLDPSRFHRRRRRRLRIQSIPKTTTTQTSILHLCRTKICPN